MSDLSDKIRRRQHEAIFILDELLDESLPVCSWTVLPDGRIHLVGVIDAPYEQLESLVGRWAAFLRASVDKMRTPLQPWTRISCQARHRGIYVEIFARVPDPIEEEEPPTPLEDLVGNWARRRPRLSPDPDAAAYFAEDAADERADLARDL